MGRHSRALAWGEEKTSFQMNTFEYQICKATLQRVQFQYIVPNHNSYLKAPQKAKRIINIFYFLWLKKCTHFFSFIQTETDNWNIPLVPVWIAWASYRDFVFHTFDLHCAKRTPAYLQKVLIKWGEGGYRHHMEEAPTALEFSLNCSFSMFLWKGGHLTDND